MCPTRPATILLLSMLAMPAVQHGPGALPAKTAICIGAFDGFHLGHQALLERARDRSERVAVVTFDPHPAHILAPHRVPRLICSPTQRLRVLDHLGAERLVLLRFDRKLAALPPEAFLERYITGGLRPAAVVVGDDFRFGHRRRGDLTLMARHFDEIGTPFEAVGQVPAPAEAKAGELSSSTIRRALTNGNVAAAGAMLGRWHTVFGRVIRGARRGRELGVPTANIEPETDLLPAPGIYATLFTVWDRRSPHYGSVWPAATSLGTNPTFVRDKHPPVRLESHVLDRDLGEDLYDLDVSVAFVGRLRDEASFPDRDGLVAQIQHDIRQTGRTIDSHTVSLSLRPPR